jgi:hypothetical protein
MLVGTYFKSHSLQKEQMAFLMIYVKCSLCHGSRNSSYHIHLQFKNTNYMSNYPIITATLRPYYILLEYNYSGKGQHSLIMLQLYGSHRRGNANGAEVLEKTVLSGTPVKAMSVKLITRSSLDRSETAQKEIHYLYYIDGNKWVYDLSFNLDQIKEDQTLEIAEHGKEIIGNKTTSGNSHYVKGCVPCLLRTKSKSSL